jgi:hypothetical protein
MSLLIISSQSAYQAQIFGSVEQETLPEFEQGNVKDPLAKSKPKKRDSL